MNILPVTIMLGGVDGRTVVVELDDGTTIDLSPDDARTVATDLLVMADEAES